MKRVVLLALLVLTLWGGLAAYQSVTSRKIAVIGHTANLR